MKRYFCLLTTFFLAAALLADDAETLNRALASGDAETASRLIPVCTADGTADRLFAEARLALIQYETETARAKYMAILQDGKNPEEVRFAAYNGLKPLINSIAEAELVRDICLMLTGEGGVKNPVRLRALRYDLLMSYLMVGDDLKAADDLGFVLWSEAKTADDRFELIKVQANLMMRKQQYLEAVRLLKGYVDGTAEFNLTDDLHRKYEAIHAAVCSVAVNYNAFKDEKQRNNASKLVKDFQQDAADSVRLEHDLFLLFYYGCIKRTDLAASSYRSFEKSISGTPESVFAAAKLLAGVQLRCGKIDDAARTYRGIFNPGRSRGEWLFVPVREMCRIYESQKRYLDAAKECESLMKHLPPDKKVQLQKIADHYRILDEQNKQASAEK